jgi:hypothetical protein
VSGLVVFDLDALRVVIDGVAHRLRVTRLPYAGEQVTTFCRVRVAASFDEGSLHVVPVPCLACSHLHASHTAAEAVEPARVRAYATRVETSGSRREVAG